MLRQNETGVPVLAALKKVLEEDPRPAYQEDPERIYAFEFAGQTVRFRVRDGLLTVTEIGSGAER